MPYFSAVVLLIVSLFLYGCGSPDQGDQSGVLPQPAGDSVDVEKTAPSWFEIADDPQSAATLYKSPSDNRSYRYKVLDNGLKVLVVSDPTADKAAASLSIDVGSFENPADREGLAHFLEHMLFLGTDKYPQPGEYQAYISEHGGAFNAYTSLEETNYFFQIDPDYLVPTLDRFSRFFVAPLFNADYVDRERHAVDSEYQLKIKDDSRREWEVMRILANPEHPISLFSVGNLETLKNTEDDLLREDLIAFYKKYYSASRMNLVVLGNESLDALEQVVVERFRDVPTHEVVLEEKYTPLFKMSLPAKVAIAPEKEVRALSFNFPMPTMTHDWQLKPDVFIGHLLGHEGEGSLLARLKVLGLAEGLSSGLTFDSRHGALLSVRIRLTPQGVALEDRVTGLFFNWLKLVKEQGLDSWRYDELRKMSQIHFQFQEKHNPMGYVRRLSTTLHHYAPEEVLRGGHLFGVFDKARLKEVMAYLTPENVAVFLMAPEVETDRKTSFYNVPYAVRPLTVAALTEGEGQHGLQLPQVNPYIPQDPVKVVNNATQQAPDLLAADSQVWFLRHNPYNTPKAYFEAKLSVPGDVDVKETVGREFVLALIMDELASELYPASLAGLNFWLNAWEQGYKINIAGFSEKQPVLLNRLLKVIQTPDWDEERMGRVRQSMLRSWRNAAKEWPMRQLFTRFGPLIKRDWLPQQKAAQLEELTIDQLKAIHGEMIAGVAGRFYGAGEMSEDSMKAMVGQISEKLQLDTDAAVASVDIYNLKPAQSLFANTFYVDHSDSAAMLYLQGQTDSLKERAMFALLEVMASAPFYSTLRTEKQLGYAVGSSIAHLLRVPGISFYVQSPKVDAQALRTEINGFFQTLSAEVEALSQKDLDRYRNSVLSSIEQKPKNLDELAGRHLESLGLGFEKFDFREQLSAAMKAITLEEFKGSFHRVFLDERTGFWILTATDPSAGTGEPLPETILEESFSYAY